MPIVLVILFLIVAALIAALCIWVGEYRGASIPIAVAIAITAWIVVAYNQIPEILSDEVHPTQTIEHTDGSSITIMVIEGQIVNLTKEMGLSFPSGTKIRRVTTSQSTGGIWWMGGGHMRRSTDPGWGKGRVSYNAVVK